MELNYIFLQAAGQNAMYPQLLMLLAIVAIFYFFMIRPQMKKQKETKVFIDSLKSGDKVVTNGGIYGKIVEISDLTVIMEVEGKMRLKVDKRALIKDSSEIQPVK